MSLSLIGDLSHESVIVVCMVVYMLSPAIRQSHAVGALHVTAPIRGLPGIVVGAGVVVMDAVRVTVGVGRLLVGRGGGVVGGCRLFVSGGWFVVCLGRWMVGRCWLVVGWRGGVEGLLMAVLVSMGELGQGKEATEHLNRKW